MNPPIQCKALVCMEFSLPSPSRPPIMLFCVLTQAHGLQPASVTEEECFSLCLSAGRSEPQSMTDSPRDIKM